MNTAKLLLPLCDDLFSTNSAGRFYSTEVRIQAREEPCSDWSPASTVVDVGSSMGLVGPVSLGFALWVCSATSVARCAPQGRLVR